MMFVQEKVGTKEMEELGKGLGQTGETRATIAVRQSLLRVVSNGFAVLSAKLCEKQKIQPYFLDNSSRFEYKE